MRKTILLWVIMMSLGCGENTMADAMKCLDTVAAIYAGKVNVKKRSYLGTGKNLTIITLNNPEYIAYELTSPLSVANNCAIQLYRQYSESIDVLQVEIIDGQLQRQIFEFEEEGVRPMLADIVFIEERIAKEINALVARDKSMFISLLAGSRTDKSEEALLEEMEPMIASFPASYSRLQIIGVETSVVNEEEAYVINMAVFGASGFPFVYETLISKRIIEIESTR